MSLAVLQDPSKRATQGRPSLPSKHKATNLPIAFNNPLLTRNNPQVAPLPGALGALGALAGGGGGGGQPNVFGNLADTMAAGRSAGARSLAAAVSRLRGLWRPPVIAKVADFGLRCGT